MIKFENHYTVENEISHLSVGMSAESPTVGDKVGEEITSSWKGKPVLMLSSIIIQWMDVNKSGVPPSKEKG